MHPSWAALASSGRSASWAALAAQAAESYHDDDIPMEGQEDSDAEVHSPTARLAQAALQKPLPHVPALDLAEFLGTTRPAPHAHATLSKSIAAVLDLMETEEWPDSSPHIQRVSGFYFQRGPQLHTTKEAIAQKLGVDRRRLEGILTNLVSTFLQVDHFNKHLFEQNLKDSLPDSSLVAFFELTRFDETPLRVGQQQSMKAIMPSAMLVDTADSAKAAGHLGQQGDPGPSLPPSRTVSKILAVESKYVIILKLEMEDESEPRLVAKHVTLQGQCPGPLFLLERATGAVLRQCLQEATVVSKHLPLFPWHLRITTTDQAQAKYAAEQGVLESRRAAGTNWGSLHVPCYVHIVARIFTKSFALMESDISGMVNLALHLSLGANMLRFRKALLEVVLQKVEVSNGYPSLGVKTYRTAYTRGGGGTRRES